MTPVEMTPERIEEFRKASGEDGLCELALDGLRFRAWINGIADLATICEVAKAIAYARTPNQYRTAIDGLIGKGRIRP